MWTLCPSADIEHLHVALLSPAKLASIRMIAEFSSGQRNLQNEWLWGDPLYAKCDRIWCRRPVPIPARTGDWERWLHTAPQLHCKGNCWKRGADHYQCHPSTRVVGVGGNLQLFGMDCKMEQTCACKLRTHNTLPLSQVSLVPLLPLGIRQSMRYGAWGVFSTLTTMFLCAP